MELEETLGYDEVKLGSCNLWACNMISVWYRIRWNKRGMKAWVAVYSGAGI